MTKLEEFLKSLIGTLFLIFRVIRNKSFLNRFPKASGHGKSLYVLGNGPSLKEVLSTDADFLSGQDLFAVNKFFLTPQFQILKPRYYMLLDPAFNVSANTLPKYLRMQKDILRAFADTVTWPMILFVPTYTDMQEQWTQLQESNGNIKVFYTSIVCGTASQSLKQALYKRSLAMPAPTNVLVAAIFIGLNMGYSEINVLGGDHSWVRDLKVDENNNLSVLDAHFYGGGEVSCVNAGERDSAYTMSSLLSAWASSYESYFELNAYAETIGSKVYNLTEGSYIDAFPRRRLRTKDGVEG